MSEDDKRKHDAKRFNEHIKLLVTSLNAVALIVLAASVLQPIILSGPRIVFSAPRIWIWIGLGVTLHSYGAGAYSPAPTGVRS